MLRCDPKVVFGESATLDAVVSPTVAGAYSWQRLDSNEQIGTNSSCSIAVGGLAVQLSFWPQGLASLSVVTTTSTHWCEGHVDWSPLSTTGSVTNATGTVEWQGVLPCNTDDDNLDSFEDRSNTVVDAENDLPGFDMRWTPCCHPAAPYEPTGCVTFACTGGGSIKTWATTNKSQAYSNPLTSGEKVYVEGVNPSTCLGDTLLISSVGAATNIPATSVTNALTVLRLDVLVDVNHDGRVDRYDTIAAQSQCVTGLVMGCGSQGRTRIELRTDCKLTSGMVPLWLDGTAGACRLWEVGNTNTPFLVSGSQTNWQGSDIAALPTNRVLEIDATNSGSFSISYSYIDNPADPPNSAAWYKRTLPVTVLKVDFVKLWETENKANQLFNPTRKDDPVDDDQDPDANGDTYGVPRNYIYMVPNPVGDTYNVTIKADIQPADLRTRFYAAGYVGSTIVSGSGRIPFDANGECELNFLHPGSSPGVEDFTIKVGFDQNDNGELDSGDLFMPCVVKNTTTDEVIGDPMVKGSSATRYTSAKSVIDNRVTVWGTEAPVLEHARALLRIFRDGNAAGVPTEKQPTDSDTSSFNAFTGYFAEWLTHNSGAPFDDSGNATLTEYYWGEFTSLADLVATAPQIEDPISAFYNATVYSVVTNYFAGLPVGSTATFPSANPEDGYSVTHVSESPAWVAPGTPTIELNSWLWDKVDDVNGTVGRGRLLSHKVRYKVEKQETLFGSELVITEIRSWGEVSDLYDFNHDVGGAAQDAAILQIGYGNGSYGSPRNRGMIFRDRIEFNKPYTELP